MWASSFVAIRGAGQYFAPGALALGRLLIGTVVLGLVCAGRREGWPPRAAWPGAAGITISLLGTIIVGVSSAETTTGQSSLTGIPLCVLAAVSYAASAVIQKPALRQASALQVTTFGCAAGAAACLPFAGQLASRLAGVPWTAALGMVYPGVFPTAVAFTTWAYALARTPAGKMGAIVYAIPALTILMTWAILREVPRWPVLAGAPCAGPGCPSPGYGAGATCISQRRIRETGLGARQLPAEPGVTAATAQEPSVQFCWREPSQANV